MFHEIILQLRKDAGLRQEDVARICNISARQYHRIEKGEQKPSYENFLALANCFNVSLDYLAERTDIRENPNVPNTIQNNSSK